MATIYPPSYEKFYASVSRRTGMPKEEIDMLILTMIKVIKADLDMKGEVCMPYLGKFYLKRLPPRKRSVKDFATDERFTIDIPARDKVKFKVNKEFSKLFR